MEHGSIEREIHVQASPEVVFEVITSPQHIHEWWNGAQTQLDARPGANDEFVWGDRESSDVHIAPFTVVEADPPRLFSFRWTYDAGSVPGPDNSLLVTFELLPSGAGTTLRMTETGFRERGWDVAQREEAYADHVHGWELHLGALERYVDRLATTS